MSLFETMKGIKLPTTDAERNELVVTEGANGFWNYHLARRVNHLRALCGAALILDADDGITLGLGQARNRRELFRAGLRIRIDALPRSCPGGARQQGDQQGGR